MLGNGSNGMTAEDRMALEGYLKYLEGEIGTKDAWVLIGEAYVRGAMEGQAVSPETRLQGIAIV